MRIVGNLDVEVTWARMDAAARRARGEKAPSPDDPRFALPEPVMRKISAAATLMRVFAQSDDDILWTPRPVDPLRMAKVDWLPTPRLESGPRPDAADVWWGETTDLAARLNDRGLCVAVRRAAGVETYGEAVRTVGQLEALSAKVDDWVAKAPLSAAGRLRFRGQRANHVHLRRARSYIDLYGCLYFEPWFHRHADFGVRCDVDDRGARAHREHGLDVDVLGHFKGIVVPGTMDPDLRRLIDEAVVVAAGRELASAGHCGSFEMDVFVTLGPGAQRLHLAEINVRRTFGDVAFALWRRALGHLLDGEAERVSLRFGRGAPPADTIPLLLPGTDDDTSAWLELPRRHTT